MPGPRADGRAGSATTLAMQRHTTGGVINEQPWLRWYKLAKWRDLRWQVLVRDNFSCSICGRVETASKLVCDHIVSHRGDQRKSKRAKEKGAEAP